MNLAGKVLVVLVVILSAAYFGITVMLFGQRTNWKKAYDDMALRKDGEIKAQRDEAARFHYWAVSLKNESDRYRSQVDVLQQTTNRLDTEAKAKDEQISKAQEQVKAAQANSQAWQKELEEQKKVAQGFKAEADKYSGQLEAAQKVIVQRDDQIAGLRKNIDQLEDDKKMLVLDNRKLTEDLAKLENAWREAQKLVVLPDVGDFPPPMDATVIDYRPELRLVVLNVGREHGVKVNYKFTVYRKDNYVCKVVVDMVDDKVCTARPVEGMMAEGQEIEIGDSATTRIQ